MKQILLATGNAHKKEEFAQMLEPLGYRVLSLKDIGFKDEIVEDGTTFAQNATIKVKALREVFDGEIISDDSGICIAHLNGEPGIYSARYLGGDEVPYAVKNNQIIEMLQEANDRSAYYECDIAYLNGDEVIVFDGIMEGTIALRAMGSNGFGYDPIFIPNGHEVTLAQMSPEQKNQISHRSKALAKFLTFLKSKEQ